MALGGLPLDPHNDLRCPLYIGATAWPSLHDEERVDAAYNQEGLLWGCCQSYRINIYMYTVYIYMVCLPPFNIFLIYMVNIETYTIHAIHWSYGNVSQGVFCWGFWDFMFQFVIVVMVFFVHLLDISVRPSGFGSWNHSWDSTVNLSCICSRKHVIFTMFSL